ncbi:MAG TPA: NFACT RNA binding domain-containing protein [Oscillospiraceae bacterium]|nr:NFACT RNA binding domain-containing protein [Oscillospiraceae bacterium]
MALDGVFLHFLIEEIKDTALFSRVDKIHQPSKSELVFSMRNKDGGFKLLFSANAESARVNITELEYDNPKTPPMLCMLLRKRIGFAQLTEIRQDGLDRVVFFDFLATNEIGDKESLTLIVEIMAQHSNIILVDENSVIIDAIKRSDEKKSSYRLILPGKSYVPPPAQNKLNLLNIDEKKLLAAINLHPEKQLSSALVNTLSGFSPFTARELSSLAVLDDPNVTFLSDKELASVKTVLLKLKDKMEKRESKPTVILSESKEPLEFSFMDIMQYGKTAHKKTFDFLCPLLDFFYNERDTLKRMKARIGELYKFAEVSLERAAKKITVRQAEYKESENRNELKISAELITANLHKLSKGVSFYKVENYYDNNNMIRIVADPALTPTQNAQKYYKEYKKAQTAAIKLKSLINEAYSELSYFESVCDALSRAALEDEVLLIREELIEQGYLKNKKQQKKSKVKKLKPHEFTTSEGFLVLVGRNNSQNDMLTFKLAQKSDIWFHVSKAPGSHVILKTNGKTPSSASIVEAAKIAVKHSSLSKNTKTSVDYTEVKNLKKPAGSKPGFTVYNTYNSIIVG